MAMVTVFTDVFVFKDVHDQLCCVFLEHFAVLWKYYYPYRQSTILGGGAEIYGLKVPRGLRQLSSRITILSDQQYGARIRMLALPGHCVRACGHAMPSHVLPFLFAAVG
jgi:hypothetical protein